MKQVVFLEENEYLMIKLRIERALEDVIAVAKMPYLAGRVTKNLREALSILNGKSKEENKMKLYMVDFIVKEKAENASYTLYANSKEEAIAKAREKITQAYWRNNPSQIIYQGCVEL